MNAGQFARRLAYIEHQHKRSRDYKRKAVRSLVREAGAIPMARSGKLTGWRLPNGQIVCKKRRYKSHDEAALELLIIQARPWTKKVPTRAYHCNLCHGWHLTSQPPMADNDN